MARYVNPSTKKLMKIFGFPIISCTFAENINITITTNQIILTTTMKWIVITTPEFIDNEATYINQLFEQGIDLLHLRKPESQKEDCERLIQEIDERWRGRIVVHDHFELCEKYHLHGIHLNRRNHTVPKGFKGSISRSCHSLEEAKAALSTKVPSDKAELPTKVSSDKTALSASSPEQKEADYAPYDYVFLSPIFDSISKEGYNHAFSNRDLEDASQSGIINNKVIALGGVIPEYIPQLKAWNFGGCAFLGGIWNKVNTNDWCDYLAYIKKRLAPTSAKNTLSGSKVW